MPASTARTMLVRALHRSSAPGLLLTCSLLCCACGKEPPLPQKPAPRYGIPQPRPTNTSVTPPIGQSPEANRWSAERASEVNRHPRFDQPSRAPEKVVAESAEKKQRDYSAELTELLGKALPSCLTSSKPSAAAITIQVTAQVMSSGTVSRAEAQAPGLAPPVLACIKTAVGALQLRGPVDDAPRSVRAQLTLQTQGTPNAAQPKAAVQAPQPEDERDENPRDSQHHQVDNEPSEVEQKLYEPAREAPEPADPKDEPPADNHADQQP